MTPWKQLNLDDARDVFRQAVLDGLDKAACEIFAPLKNGGASDADLPRLFKAIDVQIETLAKRYNVALVEEQHK